MSGWSENRVGNIQERCELKLKMCYLKNDDHLYHIANILILFSLKMGQPFPSSSTALSICRVFLGQVYSILLALLNSHPMTLASSISWSLHGNLLFTFTVPQRDLSEFPWKALDFPIHGLVFHLSPQSCIFHVHRPSTTGMALPSSAASSGWCLFPFGHTVGLASVL